MPEISTGHRIALPINQLQKAIIMFTVKLLKHEEGSELWTILSCPHYSITRNMANEAKVLVTVYKDHTRLEGVDYSRGPDMKGDFEACFVENDAGKTIEHIRPVVNWGNAKMESSFSQPSSSAAIGGPQAGECG